jgi:zinc finger SWIM domain-containing protein 3
LTTEDKDSFTWFLETFRANNPQTELTKCIMTDKDLLERSVIKDTFSEANVIICIFHSMRIFSREITCEKMGISQADRNKSLEILQKMVYAKTEGEFEQLHNVLNISAPKRVIEYFDKNWYPIKDEWSMSKNFMKGCFQNTTNNRIESINAKLKSVITKKQHISRVRAFIFHHYIIP